jgi:simple sugar transport system permease protein
MDMYFIAFVSSVFDQSTPILLAGLAAMITLRANILNVAVEGMMLIAAFTAVAVGDVTQSAWLALIAAVAVAILFSQVLALLTLRFQADFIVAGLGINLLGAGVTLFMLEWFYENPGGLRPVQFPELWHVPSTPLFYIPVLSGMSIIVLITLLLVPVSYLFLYHTPIGFYLRAVGEDEHAARSAGIRVGAMKALAVGISGLLSGLAGAQLAMDKLHFFLPDMTSGRGFVGLAATLFGNGLPGMTTFAAFLFGFFGALGDRLQAFNIPSEFVLMLPYVAAVLGLTFARWRAYRQARPPRIERA